MGDQKLMTLKAERDQLRRVFADFHNQVMEMAKGENIQRNEFEVKFAKAEDKVQRLFKLDEQVSEILLLTDSDEIELNKEFDKIEEYREKWLEIIVVYRTASNLAMDNKRKYRLPKVELPTFNGDSKSWINFWTEFKKIHEDNALDDEDKFYYLHQSIKDGSPAGDVISRLPCTPGNYSKAVEELKARFGNNDLMKRLYVRELLKLVLSQISAAKHLSLRSLYDKLEMQVRSLENLGVTNEELDCLIFPIVESALPEYILREWERRKSIKETMADTLEDLLRFVKNEVECEERVTLLARSNYAEFRGSSKRALKHRNDKRKDTRRSKKDTNTVNLRTNPKNVCLFCGTHHGYESCHKAVGMSVDQIYTMVKNTGACYKCLKVGHNVRYCREKVICVVCKGRHNALMCRNRGGQLGVSPEGDSEMLEHNITTTFINTVQLQTLVVTIKSKMQERKVRVLVDSASQRSYVTRRLVNIMGYEPENDMRLAHTMLESSNTDPSLHRCYKVRLSSINSSYSCNFVALDAETINQNVPVAAAGSWLSELESIGIVLTESNESSIDILIGADVAGKLLSGRRKILSSGMVAVETFLGWTVMGNMRDEASSCVSYISSTEIEVSDSNNEIIEYSKWWENPNWIKFVRMSGVIALKVLHMSGFLPQFNWKKCFRGKRKEDGDG